ncbi:hypothetical protein CKO15_13275 [Halorhodospira abdelmalekii]|nr:hypothetical protein [Halorhodospira abdelmalekii]
MCAGDGGDDGTGGGDGYNDDDDDDDDDDGDGTLLGVPSSSSRRLFSVCLNFASMRGSMGLSTICRRATSREADVAALADRQPIGANVLFSLVNLITDAPEAVLLIDWGAWS